MRILFSVQPATGHLQPMVALCATLLERGHDLRVVSAPSFAPAIEAFGLPALSLGLDWLRADVGRFFPEARDLPSDRKYPWVLTELYAGSAARRLLPALEALAGEWCPDVILRDQMEFGSWLFAERRGIPHLSFGYGLGFQERDRQMAGPALAKLRVEAGLPPDPALDSLFHHARLELAPASYRLPDSRPIPTTRHVRYRPSDRRRDDPRVDWLAEIPGERPLVIATLGTNYNRTPGLFERIIEALATLPVEVVVTSGDTRAPENLGPLPDNVHALRYAPLSEILPRASAIVCHAGFNTIMTAALEAVPLVLIPIDSDQPAQALRCEALGIGRSLSHDELSVRGLRAAVAAVLEDPRFRTAMEGFREEVLALPDENEVADMLEVLAAQRAEV